MTHLKTEPKKTHAQPSLPRAGKKFRAAFFAYPTAFQSPGGGEIQLLKTKEYLEHEGVEVKLFDPWSDKLSSFDLLHIFGSVKDCLDMIRTAKVLGLKTVLSTICWYSWQSAWGIYSSWGQRSLSVTRHIGKAFCPFIPSMRKSMMDVADLLYPNSESEAHQLQRFFCAPKEKIFVIPNGTDDRFIGSSPEAFVDYYGLEDFILCVGRIEPRKNQLNMIRALKGVKTPLVIIGDYVHAYRDYYIQCRKEADSNVYFLGSMDHNAGLLASAYAACNTFLLPSWLETPGLAALEAGLTGAKVVITDQGATTEYFSKHADYVQPWDLRVIRTQTIKSLAKPKSDSLKQHIQQNYLWKHAAKRTLQGYQKLLGNP
jgi:glycosyltransferase involved in cell wall biosynthesis